jgi:hypothetical protein
VSEAVHDDAADVRVGGHGEGSGGAQDDVAADDNVAEVARLRVEARRGGGRAADRRASCRRRRRARRAPGKGFRDAALRAAELLRREREDVRLAVLAALLRVQAADRVAPADAEADVRVVLARARADAAQRLREGSEGEW